MYKPCTTETYRYLQVIVIQELCSIYVRIYELRLHKSVYSALLSVVLQRDKYN